MKDVIIKCEKGEVYKTLAYIEKKDRTVRWASGDKPTGYCFDFDRKGVYLVIENDVLTFIQIDEFVDSDKKGKDVVSADEFLGKNSKPSIVIFRRDRNVIAKDVATGDEGIAKCSPDDDFVFKTGAAIALARLMAKTPDVLNHDVKEEWIKVLGVKDSEKKVYTDADRNFKVGDRVVVRDWDDMAKEYGTSEGGTIHCCFGFTDTMRHLCGRTATVKEVIRNYIKVDFDDKSGDTLWSYSTDMFNPIDILAQSKTPEAEFKVGDHVIIRQWDDMKKTGRQDNAGNIFDTHHKGCFSTAMKSICGKEVEIIESDPGNNERFKIAAVINGCTKKWWVRTWMIERLAQKPTPKFKVGDYVTLKEDVEANKWYGGLELLSGAMYDNAHNQRMTVVRVDWSDDSNTYFYECKGDFRFTFHYSEEMLDKCDESKIYEGDKVRIKKGCTGKRYDTYYEWVREHITDPELLLAFEREDHVDTSLDYEVVKIAPHKLFSQKPVAYIKHKGDYRTICYLFDAEALEKV